MKINKICFLLFLSSIVLVSCEPEDKSPDSYDPKGIFDSGVLVLNEGSFGTGNASISFISFDLNLTQNNIFSNSNNGVALGDTAQSIAFKDDLAYIVVNGSNKIEVANRNTMIKIATISSGLINPRYMTFANGKGYVTNWGVGTNPNDDFVAVINLTNNTVSSAISVTEGPEQIVENAGNLYVSHKGGYGFGKTISVINTTNNSVTNSILVRELPNEMQIDNGFLWVLCEGNPSYVESPLEETAGSLQKINLTTNTVVNTYNFPATKHPRNLAITNNKAYYTLNSSIYKMNLLPIEPATSISLPLTAAFTSATSNIYGFAVRNNRIYISGYDSFSANGNALVYSLGDFQDSQPIGTLLRNTGVGVGPNGFYFNQ